MTAAEALRGPWRAQALNERSEETAITEDIVCIRVARGAAIHRPHQPNPASLDLDVLYEIDLFWNDDEVRSRWAQAQAVAESLNAAAQVTR